MWPDLGKTSPCCSAAQTWAKPDAFLQGGSGQRHHRVCLIWKLTFLFFSGTARKHFRIHDWKWENFSPRYLETRRCASWCWVLMQLERRVSFVLYTECRLSREACKCPWPEKLQCTTHNESCDFASTCGTTQICWSKHIKPILGSLSEFPVSIETLVRNPKFIPPRETSCMFYICDVNWHRNNSNQFRRSCSLPVIGGRGWWFMCFDLGGWQTTCRGHKFSVMSEFLFPQCKWIGVAVDTLLVLSSHVTLTKRWLGFPR